jgi:hypothetical protein
VVREWSEWKVEKREERVERLFNVGQGGEGKREEEGRRGGRNRGKMALGWETVEERCLAKSGVNGLGVGGG